MILRYRDAGMVEESPLFRASGCGTDGSRFKESGVKASKDIRLAGIRTPPEIGFRVEIA